MWNWSFTYLVLPSCCSIQSPEASLNGQLMPESNLEADMQFHLSLVLRRQVTSKGICLTSAQQFLTSDNHHPLLNLISSGKSPFTLQTHVSLQPIAEPTPHSQSHSVWISPNHPRNIHRRYLPLWPTERNQMLRNQGKTYSVEVVCNSV